jgi:hypothetical protein
MGLRYEGRMVHDPSPGPWTQFGVTREEYEERIEPYMDFCKTCRINIPKGWTWCSRCDRRRAR